MAQKEGGARTTIFSLDPASVALQEVTATAKASIATVAPYVPPPSMGAKRLNRAATCAVPLASAAVVSERAAASAALAPAPLGKLKHIPRPSEISSTLPVKGSESGIGAVAVQPTQNTLAADLVSLRKIMGELPVVAPTTAPEARAAAAAAADLRSQWDAQLGKMNQLALKQAALQAQQKTQIASLALQNHTLQMEVVETRDLICAADQRISELHELNHALHDENAEQQRTFDSRIRHLALSYQNAVKHTQKVMQSGVMLTQADRRPPSASEGTASLERYVNEDIERLTTENKSLRATVTRLEKSRLESAALNERIRRLVAEHGAAKETVHALEEKNAALVVEMEALLGKVAQLQQDTTATAQDLVSARLKGRPAKLKEAVVAALHLVCWKQQTLQVFHKWRRFLLARKGTQQELLLSRKTQEFARHSESSELALAEQKYKHATELAHAQALFDKQTLEVASLRERISALDAAQRHLMLPSVASPKAAADAKPRAATSAPVAGEEDNPSNGTSSAAHAEIAAHLGNVTMHELQTKALEVYNLLLPVLQGVKSRLKLTIDIPHLKLYQSTENIVVLVLRWIEKHYKFLYLLLTLDDRLSKTKSKLIFIAVRVRQKMKNLEDRARFIHDAPSRGILSQRLAGYHEVQQKITALRSRIDASRLSLRSTGDAEKQKEVAALTNTFEAEVEEFARLLKIAESLQFRLALEFMKTRNIEQTVLRDRIADEAKRSPSFLLHFRGKAGVGLVQPKSGAKKEFLSSDTATADDPRVEGKDWLAAGSTDLPESSPLPLVPRTQQNDPFEHSKHHLLYIGSLVPVDKHQLIRKNHLETLLRSEFEVSIGQKKVAVSPELQEHRQRMKRQALDRKQDPGLKRALLVHGGLEHFVSHSGAIIPFRSNLSRHRVAVESPARSTDAGKLSLAEQLLGAQV